MPTFLTSEQNTLAVWDRLRKQLKTILSIVLVKSELQGWFYTQHFLRCRDRFIESAALRQRYHLFHL